MWILRGSGTGGRLTFRFPSGAARTIGRAQRADFVVDAPLVSRVHCRIVAGDRDLAVEDLSSKNGTFVNDRRIEKSPLASGDRLRIGRIELTVERRAGASAA